MGNGKYKGKKTKRTVERTIGGRAGVSNSERISKPHRSWCFTYFQYQPEDFERLKGIGKGVTMQEEISEGGNRHIQGYVEFGKPTTFAQCCRMVGTGAHVFPRTKTRENASRYCRDITKRDGLAFDNIKVSGQGRRSDLDTIHEELDKGSSIIDISDNHFSSYCRFSKSFNSYIQLHAIKRRWEMDVYVLWGRTNTGKSRLAFEVDLECYTLEPPNVKDGPVWWSDYQGEDTVVIDEFTGWMGWEYFKRLLDRHPFRVQPKGGFCQFRSKRIILTSNVAPINWYPTEDYEQLKRRITKIWHVEHFLDNEEERQDVIQTILCGGS